MHTSCPLTSTCVPQQQEDPSTPSTVSVKKVEVQSSAGWEEMLGPWCPIPSSSLTHPELASNTLTQPPPWPRDICTELC